MPSEVSRKTSTKRIFNPSDNSQFVDVPVIDEITFVDDYDRRWEIVLHVSNKDEDSDQDKNRKVHVKRITNSNDNSMYFDAERIDMIGVLDEPSRSQETEDYPDNVTGDDSTPPHLITHLKTHVKRITNPANADLYIDMERIDEIAFIDPNERFQETVYQIGPWEDENA